MNLTQEDIAELLVVLNVALSEARDENQREILRRWIHRLSQQISNEPAKSK